MKKISNSQWERYKNHDGKNIIEQFNKLANDESFSLDLAIELARTYDKQVFANAEEEYADYIQRVAPVIFEDVKAILEQEEEITYGDIYLKLMEVVTNGVTDLDLPLDEHKDGDFKNFLSLNLIVSEILYYFCPEFFIPNFFVMQFVNLKKIAEKYELELPELPKRSKYAERCLYYVEMCAVLQDFAEENKLNSEELCAFLYDYEAGLIREELESDERGELPEASQAWFLVGTYGEEEATMESGFWQASAETKRGDIMVFYEKAPAKAINSYWRATEDGVVDPFFYYYSNTYIADKKDIPAITLDELRADSYFAEHPLIHKNFQGGSGWPLTSEDYANLKRILEAKGFDTSSMPKLMAHEIPADIDITMGGTLKPEEGVHKVIVLPLLEKMGWTAENGHIAEQVNYHLGRGEARTTGRTDINLHPYGDKKAKVVIEEKALMNNEAEIKATFEQGKSYALQAYANTMAICDARQIRVYSKVKDDFNDKKFEVFYWDEMGNPDKFNALKKLLS